MGGLQTRLFVCQPMVSACVPLPTHAEMTRKTFVHTHPSLTETKKEATPLSTHICVVSSTDAQNRESLGKLSSFGVGWTL